MRNTVVWSKPKAVEVGFDQIRDAAMFDHHTFGLASGSRCIDDIRKRARINIACCDIA